MGLSDKANKAHTHAALVIPTIFDGGTVDGRYYIRDAEHSLKDLLALDRTTPRWHLPWRG